jgi:hypothetical protein
MKRATVSNQRGVALFSVGVAIFALLALTVVGVDVGRIAFTATEVQNTADIAATAAAVSLLRNESAQAGANAALGLSSKNSVDGNVAIGNLDSLEIGFYNAATRTFTPGGTPAIAVRANASATVTNIAASLIGHPNSTVSRSAIAMFSPLGGAAPTLPLAIAQGMFTPNCFDDSCLPQLIQVPSTEDNTAWTGFLDKNASTDDIRDYFPTECWKQSAERPFPTLKVGDIIVVTNGQNRPLLNAVDCLVNTLDLHEFLIPVVESSTLTDFNPKAKITGFVKVVIDDVTTKGKDKKITLHAIFDPNTTGRPGGSPFGTGFVILVG